MIRTKIKFLIPLVLLFMFIGFATVSTTLSINGDMELLSDLDDFNIYYSRAIVNGVEDTSIIKSSTELDFGAVLKTVGVDYVIEYDITNASSAFDAQVSINCSASTEYFSINNEFDSETPIGARQTRTGTMTLRKIQTVAGDEQSNTISCDIVATPVERSEEGVGEIPIPLENPYYIGREIAIGDEKFNIISDNGDTVMMLAQYNLGTDYRQTIEENYVSFSDDIGWDYTPGPKEIDIQEWSSTVRLYVNEYVSYLQELSGDESLSGDLVTVSVLGNIGCSIPTNYSYDENVLETYNCINSVYNSWLINGQNWWTKSAFSRFEEYIWVLMFDGGISNNPFYQGHGVRPTITMSKESLDKLDDIITFTIQGSEYKAYEGMTWEEWVDSGFNKNNYYINESESLILYTNNLPIADVVSSDVILKNGTYKQLISFTIQTIAEGIVTGEEIYYAYKGMSWSEWCDSEYNYSHYLINGKTVTSVSGVASVSGVLPTDIIIGGNVYISYSSYVGQ